MLKGSYVTSLKFKKNEAETGWRIWQVRYDYRVGKIVLLSAHKGMVWKEDRNVARGSGRLTQKTGRGLYAFDTRARASRYARSYYRACAIGKVNMWGTVAYFDDGMKSNVASVVEVQITSRLLNKVGKSAIQELVKNYPNVKFTFSKGTKEKCGL